MHHVGRSLCLSICCLLAASLCRAEDVPPQTFLARPGKLLIREDLAKAPANVVTDAPLTKMKSGWKMWSGEWRFENGVMRGTSLAAEKRGAVAACVFPFSNAIIQFEVRIDDCKQMRFRFQDSQPEHICSVILTDEEFSAQKDDHDHTGPDKAVPFGTLRFAVPVGQKPIPPHLWKTVLVEILDSKMSVNVQGFQIHGGHPLIASHKAFFDFVVSGGSASFRNLRVWEALPEEAKK